LDMTCCLKADVSESGYLKAISENVFECLLGAFVAVATELAFPEIVCPTIIHLKSFLKKNCKNAEVAKKYKTLAEKIEENSTYIKSFRDKALEDGQVSLSDQKTQQILRVQMETATKPPPLLAYAADYFKVNKRVAAKLRKKTVETKEEKLIPKLSDKKKRKNRKVPEVSGVMFADSDEDDEQFETKLEEAQDKPSKLTLKGKRKNSEVASDDDDNDDDEEEVVVKKKSKKKKMKKIKKAKVVVEDLDNDVEDELVDLDLSD